VRPTKLTPELSERICALVRAGVPLVDAAELHDVDTSTIYRWRKRGREELRRVESSASARRKVRRKEKIFVEFCTAYARARATANVTDMNVITAAAGDDPYWAERRYRLRNPDRFKHDGVGDYAPDRDGLRDEEEEPDPPTNLSAADRKTLRGIRERMRRGVHAPDGPGASGDER
jgi:transposase-like protein